MTAGPSVSLVKIRPSPEKPSSAPRLAVRGGASLGSETALSAPRDSIVTAGCVDSAPARGCRPTEVDRAPAAAAGVVKEEHPAFFVMQVRSCAPVLSITYARRRPPLGLPGLARRSARLRSMRGAATSGRLTTSNLDTVGRLGARPPWAVLPAGHAVLRQLRAGPGRPRPAGVHCRRGGRPGPAQRARRGRGGGRRGARGPRSARGRVPPALRQPGAGARGTRRAGAAGSGAEPVAGAHPARRRGQVVSPSPVGCVGPGDQTACLRDAGVAAVDLVYQPVRRYWPFQAIELAVLLGSAPPRSASAGGDCAAGVLTRAHPLPPARIWRHIGAKGPSDTPIWRHVDPKLGQVGGVRPVKADEGRAHGHHRSREVAGWPPTIGGAVNAPDCQQARSRQIRVAQRESPVTAVYPSLRRVR
jgi:hypothetical protein